MPVMGREEAILQSPITGVQIGFTLPAFPTLVSFVPLIGLFLEHYFLNIISLGHLIG